MFLSKLYRYNKWLFSGMLLFIIIQLFCFYKGGMVFSPFYNYGMYSEVIKPFPQYELYNVYADGKIMAGDQFTPQQWDNIHYKLLQADATRCSAHFYETEINRLFKKFHLPVPPEKYYINIAHNPQEIRKLYPIRLAETFSAKHIQVKAVLYTWNGDLLVTKQHLSGISNTSFQCK